MHSVPTGILRLKVLSSYKFWGVLKSNPEKGDAEELEGGQWDPSAMASEGKETAGAALGLQMWLNHGMGAPDSP